MIGIMLAIVRVPVMAALLTAAVGICLIASAIYGPYAAAIVVAALAPIVFLGVSVNVLSAVFDSLDGE
jgi:hypothetical protein